jgi:hypothetical protein
MRPETLNVRALVAFAADSRRRTVKASPDMHKGDEVDIEGEDRSGVVNAVKFRTGRRG